MKLRRNLFLTSFLAIALSQASQAASGTWTGLGADSNWTTTGNWSASPVPGTGDTANFNSAGNGKTTITTAPAALTAYTFSTGAAAYTISAPSTTWSVPNGGGVTINSGVLTNQDLSGIQYIRPAVDSTVNFNNQGSGALILGTIFPHNPGGTNVTQSVLKFTPNASGTIEIAATKLVDNAGTNGSKKISVLLDDAGILKMAGTGTFNGTDVDGNSVTIRQGTYMANVIANIGTPRTSLGYDGRIQFGQASQTRTATLDYYNTANATTDRVFHIIDNNTGVFKVSGGASTNLTITSAITESASASGGGKLTKDGDGILTLTNTSSYTGATTVKAGTLVVDGNISTSLLTTVEDGGTLAGAGAVGALTIATGGFINPGNSPGQLTVDGNYIQAGLYTAEITGLTAETEHDQIAVTGTVDITGGSLTTVFSGSYVENNLLFILLNDGTDAITGTFTGLAEGDTVYSSGGLDWKISYTADSVTNSFTGGNDIALMAIPEPSAALLGGLGLLALLRRRR